MRATISFPRWAAQTFVLLLCVLLIVHVFGVEAFVVPTGSMAPALAGHHRALNCPDCGFHVLIGRRGSEPDDGSSSCYADAACPNCGSPLDLVNVPEAGGDHMLVNKGIFLVRPPQRWEIVVFRLFGKVFVKRIAGLPGEWILIEDGDVFINEILARKTLAELKQVRVLVYEDNHRPDPADAGSPWIGARAQTAPGRLIIKGTGDPNQFAWLTYQKYSHETGKARALTDEYAYNGGNLRSADQVHDFMIECDVELMAEAGKVGLRLTDGADSVVLELAAAPDGTTRLLQTVDGRADSRVLGETAARLRSGKTHHVEFAFADRRVSVTLDGAEIFAPVDLPPARKRLPVVHPVSLGARGVEAVFRNVRLYRDLHYTQAGRQAVGGKAVHLGAKEYFVLGDNSPNSEDSRFWAGEGKVPRPSLIGKPFLVHLPSQAATMVRFGHTWQYQLPDWKRVRWLR